MRGHIYCAVQIFNPRDDEQTSAAIGRVVISFKRYVKYTVAMKLRLTFTRSLHGKGNRSSCIYTSETQYIQGHHEGDSRARTIQVPPWPLRG